MKKHINAKLQGIRQETVETLRKHKTMMEKMFKTGDANGDLVLSAVEIQAVLASTEGDDFKSIEQCQALVQQIGIESNASGVAFEHFFDWYCGEDLN